MKTNVSQFSLLLALTVLLATMVAPASAAPTEVSATFSCSSNAECKRKCEALGPDHRWKPNPGGSTLGTCTRTAEFTGIESTGAMSEAAIYTDNSVEGGSSDGVSEMIPLPDLIAGIRAQNMLLTAGFDDFEPCQDPLITAALAGSGSDQYIQACLPSSNWGIADLASGIYHGAAHSLKCGGLAVGTVAACPGLVGLSLLFCIESLDNPDDTTPGEICREDDFGDEICTTEEIPTWLLACGSIVPATEICVDVARKFDRNCL